MPILHRIESVLNKFIWVVFVLIVTVIMFVASLKFINNIYQYAGLLPMLAFLFSILVAAALARYLSKRYQHNLLAYWKSCVTRITSRPLLVAFMIFTVSISIRFLWLYLFQIDHFQSDYKAYYERAVSYASGHYSLDEYSALFPHVFGFSYVLGGVMRLLGTSLLVPQLFNVALYAAAIILLWFLFPAKQHPGKFVVSTLFVSLWPSLIYFTTLANTEYMFIVCWLAFLLVLKHTFRKSFWATASMVVLLMLIIVMSNFIRPIGSIALIVFMIVLLLKMKPLFSFKKLALIIIAVVTYTASSSVMNSFVSSHIQMHAAKMPIGFNLFVGTNTMMQGEDLGLWNRSDSVVLADVLKETGDAQETHNLLLQQGLDRLEHWINTGKIGSFVYLKARTAWGTDGWALQLIQSHLNAFHKSESALTLFNQLYNPLVAAGDFLYVVVLALACWLLYRKLRDKQLFASGTIPLANGLFLIGTFLMLLLVESAPRYHVPGLLALLLVMTSPSSQDGETDKKNDESA